MKKCFNCIHYCTQDIYRLCRANNNVIEIKHPLFMGGKKCECYEKRNRQKNRFEYPKKNITKIDTHSLHPTESLFKHEKIYTQIVKEALIHGIWNGVPEQILSVGLVYMLGRFYLTCFDENGKPTGSYPLSEYKITWWLKKDRSE